MITNEQSITIEECPSIQIGPKPWGEELLLAHTRHYTLKRLTYLAGASGALQHHVEKDEAFHLHSGAAWVDSDDGHGQIVREKMRPGQTFHIPPGAPHRFTAITDCVVFEASTPHFDDRVDDSARYGE